MSGIGFPTQNTFVTFRADDDSRDPLAHVPS